MVKVGGRSAEGDRSGGAEEAAYAVLGCGPVGTAVAQRLRADDHTVSLVNESHDSSELPGLRGDPTDVRALEEAGVAAVSTVVVATGSDRRNLLIAQLVRAHFDVSRIVVLANVPSRLDLLADVGHEPVCATTALSDSLVESL